MGSITQKKYLINGKEIWQPDKGMSYNFSSTFTEDSARSMDGVGHFTPMFTVEQVGYSAKHVPIEDAAKLLQAIGGGRTFVLHYFSPYFGCWRSDYFYVGQGDLSIGTLEEDGEKMDQISFNMTGINPIPVIEEATT